MFVRRSRNKSLGLRPEKNARLRLECLEDRSLLSATPVPQLLITTKTGEIQTVAVDDGLSVEDAISAYQDNADVAAVELDQTVSISVIPNDTSFGSLYGMRNTGQSGGLADADIDADLAWDTATGSMTMTVGIIDTGIDYRHPDLYLNIWLNQAEIPSGYTDTDNDGIITFRDLNASPNRANLTDFNGNTYIDAGDLLNNGSGWENGQDNDGNGRVDDLIGWDFVNNDNDPIDDNNHGTHVAGTIGATGNNGVGVVGVNWQVSMAALKFLNSSGSGSTSGALAALNYAVGEGIKITNNSWGGGGFSSAMNSALTNARNAGHLFVAAAGNAGRNNDTTANYPSNYNVNNVIAVAATDRFDNLASFSNYGAATVDLGAPGVSILSTVRNGAYASFNGTSMATPHVAGAAALVWSANPSLTYSEVITRLLSTADPVASLSGKTVTGGRLNVNDALNVTPPTPPAPPPVDSIGPKVLSAVPNGTASVSSVRITFSEVIQSGSFDSNDITGFVGPTGPLSVTSVTPFGTTGTVFDVTFATQSAPGTYQFVIGSNIFDQANNPLDQNGDGTPDTFTVNFSINSTTTTTFTNITPAQIRDGWTVGTSITINQNISISDLDVRFNISHTWNSDLIISLRGPNNASITLVNRRGGSGNNFTNTTINDEASLHISQGTSPFSGSYRPEQALSNLESLNAQGTWTLLVRDVAWGDVGFLNSWSLVVTGTAGGSGLSIEDAGADSGGGEDVGAGESVGATPRVIASGSEDAIPTQTATGSSFAPVSTADTNVSRFVRERDEQLERDTTSEGSSRFAEPTNRQITSESFFTDEDDQREDSLYRLFAEVAEDEADQDPLSPDTQALRKG